MTAPSAPSAPSVQVTEIQPSYPQFTPGVSEEIAAFVGHFERGPINYPILITNVDQFKFLFGRGINEFTNDWYQVFNFLQYASKIWVIRSAGVRANAASDIITNAGNALFQPTMVIFDEYKQWSTVSPQFNTDQFQIVARTPGQWGNLLSISIITNTEYQQNVELGYNKTAQQTFSFFEPNYYGICVFRNDEIVEIFYKTFDELININVESLYIYMRGINNINTMYGNARLNLQYGIVHAPSQSELADSYAIFESPEYNIDIIISNQRADILSINLANNIRAITYIGFHTQLAQTNQLNLLPNIYTQINGLPQSDRVQYVGDIKYQRDIFTNKIIAVNMAGDIAGLKALHSTKHPWMPAVGSFRGAIKNMVRGLNLSENIQNQLYKLGINYIRSNIIETDKTFLSKASSFSQICTRSLFNHVEREIQSILNKIIFMQNDLSARERVAMLSKMYLSEIKHANGITNAFVSVYPMNNSINVDVIIKPSFTAEKIHLNISAITNFS